MAAVESKLSLKTLKAFCREGRKGREEKQVFFYYHPEGSEGFKVAEYSADSKILRLRSGWQQ